MKLLALMLFTMGMALPVVAQNSETVNLELKAKAGDAEAQYLYGKSLFDNPSTFAQAISWFEKAGEQGYLEAQKGLAMIYGLGFGLTKDLNKSAYWCEKAAMQGDAYSQLDLGRSYKKGLGVPVNYEKAAYWFMKAAMNEDIYAYSEIAEMYYLGQYYPKDMNLAVMWYQKGAEHGDAKAMKMLSLLSEKGIGIPKDKDAANLWKKKYEEQSIKDMQKLTAGFSAISSNVYSVDVSTPSDRISYWKKRAEQGEDDALCQLGEIYLTEKDVQNSEKAIDYFEKAALKGNIKAQLNLARIYRDGALNINYDIDKMLYWYQKAAERDNVYAQIRLGYIYSEAKFQRVNFQQAEAWYEKAIINGSNFAKGGLGILKYKEKKYDEAFKLLTESTSKIDECPASAMRVLSACYRYGKGTLIDNEKAEYWLSTAAQHSDEQAIEVMNVVK